MIIMSARTTNLQVSLEPMLVKPHSHPTYDLKGIIKLTLAEDAGDRGDVTCMATIPTDMEVEAHFLVKEDGIIMGITLAEMVFNEVDPLLKVEWLKKDGDYVHKGLQFGKVHGRAHNIVVAESVVLNFMQRMSGIATLTKLDINSQVVGRKDISKSVFDIWKEIFLKRKLKWERKSGNSCSSMSNEFEFLNSLISNLGDYDLILDGIHENILQLHYHDPVMQKTDLVAQLLDSGNLMVRDANDDNPKNFMWQSFDYPSDTILLGMKLRKNLATGLAWYMSLWKSIDDPFPGDFAYRYNSRG
ncbi:hypothetical protein F0562_003692 [Nyssa sinensis]|uniref:nicotinate-nucleotide diphosphorylase (carboxylating) n=1 Tax=Nyssa sinensis TaxID=561372 RepID=A0A5J5BXT1_9ASTE|nr:hypothetical protein F0562_003692 [Nyssa sinensis]